MSEFKTLSEKICSFYIEPKETLLKMFNPEDVKEFIRLLKEERESFEAQIVGMVWGLASNTDFNVKMFNNLMVELRKKHYNKCDKLAGSDLIEEKKDE